MSTKRRCEDACAAAHGLDLVGERWALLVVRQLLFGPRRFSDLRAGLPGISPNVLSQRLSELEQAGVVQRRQLTVPVAVRVYELTAWGRELEPVILALGRWAVRSPMRSNTAPVSADSLMLSLRTLFDAGAARGQSLALQFRFPADAFVVSVENGALEMRRGEDTQVDATVDTTPEMLAAINYGGYPLTRAIEEGQCTVDGSRAAVRAFLKLFQLPEPAPVGT